MLLGSIIVTVIRLTLVFGLGRDTSTTMGVIPDGNGRVMDEFVIVMKSTPGWPGLRSDGNDPGAASVNIAVGMYCELPMPKCLPTNESMEIP